MTEAEKNALAMVNAVQEERGVQPHCSLFRWASSEGEALCRAIEHHEAFRQEVSDAVELRFGRRKHEYGCLGRFIIAKPDPLVEAVNDWWNADGYASIDTFRAALAARGLKIVEDSHD